MTETIKAKLATDADLSALNISVNTTDGRVTLSGTVASPELIGKAKTLAQEADDVREVVSTNEIERWLRRLIGKSPTLRHCNGQP